jgi:uncharacterized membrane protein YfhO
MQDKVKLLQSTADFLIVEANLEHNAILLITNNYSKNWHVEPIISPPEQKQYSVLPANYILQAIPLKKGHHKIKIEYAPQSFYLGLIISTISTLIYLMLLFLHYRGGLRE